MSSDIEHQREEYVTTVRDVIDNYLNRWADEVHATAVQKGWYESTRTPGELLALIHSEVSEALEEFRNGKPYLYYSEQGGGQRPKPEGWGVELIDAVIRILDMIRALEPSADIDAVKRAKMSFNATRPHRHGGKLL